MAFFHMNSLVITSFLLVFSLMISTAVPITSGEPSLPKETHIHLYYHQINTGPNATWVRVALPVDNSTLFGEVTVMDDYLRECPELTSKIIGRAQGTTAAASMEEVALFFPVNFVFTEGEFKGSTLSLYGRDVVESSTIEMSIVGGTGPFRLTEGYAVGKKLAAPAGMHLIEFDLFISH